MKIIVKASLVLSLFLVPIVIRPSAAAHHAVGNQPAVQQPLDADLDAMQQAIVPAQANTNRLVRERDTARTERDAARAQIAQLQQDIATITHLPLSEYFKLRCVILAGGDWRQAQELELVRLRTLVEASSAESKEQEIRALLQLWREAYSGGSL
jgi:hypothetical protein